MAAPPSNRYKQALAMIQQAGADIDIPSLNALLDALTPAMREFLVNRPFYLTSHQTAKAIGIKPRTPAQWRLTHPAFKQLETIFASMPTFQAKQLAQSILSSAVPKAAQQLLDIARVQATDEKGDFRLNDRQTFNVLRASEDILKTVGILTNAPSLNVGVKLDFGAIADQALGYSMGQELAEEVRSPSPDTEET